MQFEKLSILPLQKGLEFPQPRGQGFPQDQHKKINVSSLNGISRGVGEGGLEKLPSWGRYGYFLELHNVCECYIENMI